MASRDNNFFWITTEERARVVQQQLAQIVIASYDDTSSSIDNGKLEALKTTFLDTISNESYYYTPSKAVNAIKLLAESIENITNTPIEEKLKRLAK